MTFLKEHLLVGSAIALWWLLFFCFFGCQGGTVSSLSAEQEDALRNATCQVEPDWLLVGADYQVTLFNAPKKSLLTLKIQEGDQVFSQEIVTEMASQFTLGRQAASVGAGRVEFLFERKRGQVLLAGCDFQVVSANACGNLFCEDLENCESCPKDCGTCPPVCGDGNCHPEETCQSCEVDCGTCPIPVCGDGECNAEEGCESCPQDCGVCPPLCGDGECNGNDSCENCPQDCGSCVAACGDGECNGDETCLSCSKDCGACPPVCGDGMCNGQETCTSCSEDCGGCSTDFECGNWFCEFGETCSNCSSDCGVCTTNCGNGTCEPLESGASCPQDCGAMPASCGNGWCEYGENCRNCPEECGSCYQACGNGICERSENCVFCPQDCGACLSTSCGDEICTAEEEYHSCPYECPTFITSCDNNGSCGMTENYRNCADCMAPVMLCLGDICCTDEASWPVAWAQYEDEVIDLVNQLRAQGTTCGDTYIPPQPPLHMSPTMRMAARCHSMDMLINNFLGHTSSNGLQFSTRIHMFGYLISGGIEDAAAGYASPRSVVDGWHSSPMHCGGMMLTGGGINIGVGYSGSAGNVKIPRSTYSSYWTLDAGVSLCGNHRCDPWESCSSCPQDCGRCTQ